MRKRYEEGEKESSLLMIPKYQERLGEKQERNTYKDEGLHVAPVIETDDQPETEGFYTGKETPHPPLCPPLCPPLSPPLSPPRAQQLLHLESARRARREMLAPGLRFLGVYSFHPATKRVEHSRYSSH